MKYLIALALSAIMFLCFLSPVIGIRVWHKILYDKEDTPEQKKKDFKRCVILWAIGTIIILVLTIFVW